MKTPSSLTKGRKAVYAALVVVTFFGVIEAALRLGGFEHSTRLEQMRFTFPVDYINRSHGGSYLQRDDTLFWKPVPNNLGHNSKGTYGPEFDISKPSGKFRVVCLGDSCTHIGGVSYPDHLRLLLNLGGERVEVINAGVVGYSSFQGLTRLKTEIANWKPDLITVYFGWNDHWLARGVPDHEQASRSSTLTALSALADRSRIFQLLVLARQSWIPYSEQYRVSIREYRKNLQEIARIGKDIGASVVFMTAPHALNLGISDHLTQTGEVSDPKRLVGLHGTYNDVVRQVARERSVAVADLDREFNQLNKMILFTDDHIHLSSMGRALAASLLARELHGSDILPNGDEIPAYEAVSHLVDGDLFFAGEQLSDAQQQYERALAIHPSYAKAHERLAQLLARQGRAEQALKHYQEIVRINPQFPETHYSLNEAGVNLSAKGRFQEAVRFFQEALRIKPDFARAHNNWGIALGGLGRIEEALPHYREALRIQPDYVEAHLNWGVALASQGRLQDAAEQFRQALRLKPDSTAARDSLRRAESLLQRKNAPAEP